MSAAVSERAAAIRALFAEMGERLASILDGEDRARRDLKPANDAPSTRRITDVDRQHARNIARRIGRL